jgi:hypothetical protein
LDKIIFILPNNAATARQKMNYFATSRRDIKKLIKYKSQNSLYSF